MSGAAVDVTKDLFESMFRDEAEKALGSQAKTLAEAQSRQIVSETIGELKGRGLFTETEGKLKFKPDVGDDMVEVDLQGATSLEGLADALRNGGCTETASIIVKEAENTERKLLTGLLDNSAVKRAFEGALGKDETETLFAKMRSELGELGKAGKGKAKGELSELFSVKTMKQAAMAAGAFVLGKRLMQDLAQQDPKVCEKLCLDSTNTTQSQYTDGDEHKGLKDPNCTAAPKGPTPPAVDCKTWCGTGKDGACNQTQCEQRGDNECGGIINALTCGVNNIADAAKAGIDFWKEYGETVKRIILGVFLIIGLYMVWTFLKTFIVTVPKRKIQGWRDSAIRAAGGDAPPRAPRAHP
jgi:hypothetical protein